MSLWSRPSTPHAAATDPQCPGAHASQQGKTSTPHFFLMYSYQQTRKIPDTQKAFNETQHPFILNTFGKLAIERNFLD